MTILLLFSVRFPAHADDLETVLGLNRRLRFSTTSSGREWLRPRAATERELPPELMIPLRAVNEGLVFLAAYQSKNVPAMTAVGALSLLGGTLRSGIDAVVDQATDRRLDVGALHRLDTPQLEILAYLWGVDDPAEEKSVYLNVDGFPSWKTMDRMLEAMEDLGVIERKERKVRALAARDDVVRSFVAAGRTSALSNLMPLRIGENRR